MIHKELVLWAGAILLSEVYVQKNCNKPMMMEGIGLQIFFIFFSGFPVIESPPQ